MKNFSKTKKSFQHHDEIKEDLIFGIDLGIASVGWAVLEGGKEGATAIRAMGSWCFELPEVSKTKESLNQKRREARLHRRTVRRRAQRMNLIRKLFYDHGLLPSHDKNILRDIGAELRKQDEHDKDPWSLRVAKIRKRRICDCFSSYCETSWG